MQLPWQVIFFRYSIKARWLSPAQESTKIKRIQATPTSCHVMWHRRINSPSPYAHYIFIYSPTLRPSQVSAMQQSISASSSSQEGEEQRRPPLPIHPPTHPPRWKANYQQSSPSPSTPTCHSFPAMNHQSGSVLFRILLHLHSLLYPYHPIPSRSSFFPDPLAKCKLTKYELILN